MSLSLLQVNQSNIGTTTWIHHVNKAPCKRTQHCCPTTPNLVGCYMLRLFAHPVACCCMLLWVVVQSLKPVNLLNKSQHFLNFWSICCNVGSICTALPTILGPCTCITCGLLGDNNAITSSDRATSVMGQHCWELFHPFAHHCQHEHNNSQHCWCIHLHVG